MSSWPHAPAHRFDTSGAYMVTGATLYKKKLFDTPAALDLLQTSLFSVAQRYRWQLEAWALFANHYHFIARPIDDPRSLPSLVGHWHGATAFELNKLQGQRGRPVWYQYWDTQLT